MPEDDHLEDLGDLGGLDDLRDPDDEWGDQDDHENEIPWETHARESFERAAEEVSFDEVRGVVYLQTGRDQRLRRFDEGYSSIDELRQRLCESL